MEGNYPFIDDKKASILYVLNVLKEYSDENHYMTHKEIIRRIQEMNGPDVSRKSVANSIDLLTRMNFNIDKDYKKRTALLDHPYNRNQIEFLMDAVFSSKLISSSEATALASSLSNEVSVYERNKYSILKKSNVTGRSFLRDLFVNIEIISDAIGQGSKISFQYLDYASPTTTKEKYTGKSYIVNPYYTVNMKGDYYLILNVDKYDDLSMYHIERMKDIKILDEPIKDLSKINDPKNFDIAKFLNEHIYPFIKDEVVNAKVELFGEKGIHYAVEWFGKNVMDIAPAKDGNSIATIRCDYGSLAFWCLQYPENARAISPKILTDYIRRQVTKLDENYMSGDTKE